MFSFLYSIVIFRVDYGGKSCCRKINYEIVVVKKVRGFNGLEAGDGIGGGGEFFGWLFF